MKSLVIFVSAETELWQPSFFDVDQESVCVPGINE